jgi:hypothetical protein
VGLRHDGRTVAAGAYARALIATRALLDMMFAVSVIWW